MIREIIGHPALWGVLFPEPRDGVEFEKIDAYCGCCGAEMPSASTGWFEFTWLDGDNYRHEPDYCDIRDKRSILKRFTAKETVHFKKLARQIKDTIIADRIKENMVSV